MLHGNDVLLLKMITISVTGNAVTSPRINSDLPSLIRFSYVKAGAILIVTCHHCSLRQLSLTFLTFSPSPVQLTDWSVIDPSQINFPSLRLQFRRFTTTSKMRVLIILSHLGLAAAGACPYAKLKAAGLLNDAEQSKYEEIKRDGGHLEKRAITLPGLSLNLGGGLRESSISACSPLLKCINSQWRLAVIQWPPVSSSPAYPSATRTQGYSGYRYESQVHRSRTY